MLNPLLQKWETPYETPPFHLVNTGHFKPAIEEAIRSAAFEIDRITENTELPSFENSVAALDRCGEKLGQISAVLFNLNSAETSKELQSAAQEISPLLARFSNDITLNEKLFSRIKAVFDSMYNTPGLNKEQQMLVEKKYRGFILGGSGLNEKDKSRFREISEELSKLTLRFEENVLDETNSFELHITDHQDLAGLPEDIAEMALMEAKKRKKEGWVFTLNYPSYIPFMQYSEKRELREKMLKAYSSRAFHNDDKDNKSLVSRIVNLRLETAKLLGFSNYAEMALGDRMAENPEKVESFLEDLYSASHNAALRDFENINGFASELGHTDKIERWDWAYYSEKLKKVRYDIDDETLKPYFSLDKVREAIFGLASRLYGLRFNRNDTIPVYHKEVIAYEVFDRDNSLAGILYLDFHPREGKNGGAWMTAFREQRMEKGNRIIPLISIVSNFSRPTLTNPSLLTFNELTTFLHEFGHALHGMLSQCTYESLSGTNVARDFVELPSQFMENWAFEQEWLDTWAVHFKTGDKIPIEIIKKIRDASTFNEGYACNRQLGFSFLDMAWHTITNPFEGDINDFEGGAMLKTELFPIYESLNMSCSFTHLFGGGYAAGYYGYKWAEVLDADAFRYFRESGIFNPEVADSFRKNILEKGESDKPMNLYIKFRGREPSMDAFLERSGLKEKPLTP
jgi:peptidyl-dipeptidase Dcp